MIVNNNLFCWPYLMPMPHKSNQKHSNCNEEVKEDEVKEQEECFDLYSEPHYTTDLFQL